MLDAGSLRSRSRMQGRFAPDPGSLRSRCRMQGRFAPDARCWMKVRFAPDTGSRVASLPMQDAG
ncbi:MAG: hypothetical protein M0Q38_12050 [Bacteroidales bacterium]|nr:hypothetical protein [Bacteroidales bacterium]